MGDAFADAVIVAAGQSTRMTGADKLAATLGDRSVLDWSVAAMAGATSVKRIVLVVRADRVDRMAHCWPSAMTVVGGGAQRSDSVRAGVAATSAEVVLIHDAARPMASSALADRVAQAAREQGAAVPVVPVVDSLKQVSDGMIKASVERSGLMRTQTPQAARRELLNEALAATQGIAFTDEAALLESRGVRVATVAGEATNVKITEPVDLELLRALTEDKGRHRRLGMGQDSHSFGPGLGLWLGGVHIEDAPRLFGHSDGDVVLHALATAVLSACGLGDLGRRFPPSDAKTQGIASGAMLTDVVRQAAENGWRLDTAHVSLVGARPRLGSARIDAMRDAIAALIGVSVDHVSVVASTGNLGGPDGAGRTISATALVEAYRR